MAFLHGARIAVKVALAPGFAILCLLVVGGVGLWANTRANRTLETITGERMVAIERATDVQARLTEIYASVNQSLVWEGAGMKAETIAALDERIGASFGQLGKLVETQASDPVWSG
jgi:methyl-accepting chemotaxis protein